MPMVSVVPTVSVVPRCLWWSRVSVVSMVPTVSVVPMDTIRL